MLNELHSDLIQYLIAIPTDAAARVHDDVVPQGQALPYIATVKLTGSDPLTTDGRRLFSRATIRLAIFARTGLQREGIAALIKSSLNRFRGHIGSTKIAALRVETTADEVAASDGDNIIKGTGLDLFFLYSE